MKKVVSVLVLMILLSFSLNSCEEDCECDPGSIYQSWTRLVTDAEGVQFMAELKINSGNTLDFILLETVPGHNNTTASISFDGDLMYIDDDDCENTGTYEYAVSTEALSLFVKEDDCEQRVIVLQGIWKKK